MLNKLNTKSLVVLLVALVAVIAIVVMSRDNAPTSTLPARVVEVDSSAIDRLVIKPTDHDAYELVRKSGIWKLKLGDGRLVPVENKSLNNSFSSLLNVEPKRIVTRKEEKWASYEVTDSTAAKVLFYKGEELAGGVLIGKIDFNQQTNAISNFVRREGENDVFVCDAPLTFDWNKKSADWRNKTLMQSSIASISKVSAIGGMNFTLVKDDLSGWTTQGIEADSAQIMTYISGIANLTSNEFADDVLPSELSNPIQSLEIYTELEDVTLSIYNVGNRQLIHSSVNAQNVFVLDANLASKLYLVAEDEISEEIAE